MMATSSSLNEVSPSVRVVVATVSSLSVVSEPMEERIPTTTTIRMSPMTHPMGLLIRKPKKAFRPAFAAVPAAFRAAFVPCLAAAFTAFKPVFSMRALIPFLMGFLTAFLAAPLAFPLA